MTAQDNSHKPRRGVLLTVILKGFLEEVAQMQGLIDGEVFGVPAWHSPLSFRLGFHSGCDLGVMAPSTAWSLMLGSVLSVESA